MSRIRRAWNVLTGKTLPKTKVSSGGHTNFEFVERTRNKDQLQKWKTIYKQGGIVSETLDCYHLYMLSNGWTLDGRQREVKKVEDFIDSINFNEILKSGILDAALYGDGFQENVYTYGGDLDFIALRDSTTFDIEYDQNKTGDIIGYTQTLMDNLGREYVTSVKPHQIINTRILSLAGEPYGISMIDRAYDEIMRDTKTAESTTTAIVRHGFRKYHIKVGLEGEDVPVEVMTDVDKKFRDLETKNEIATTHDVEIIDLDKEGLQNVETYNDISMVRLSAALGVPSELVGTRRLPANVKVDKRIDSFFRKLSTFQWSIARQYEMSVFDRLTTNIGDVKLIFNDISPHDEADKATWISEIMKSTPMDPFIVLPQEWIKEQFNIDPDAYKDDDDYIIPEETDDTETEQDNTE